jgi:erythromycin esterase-like protein
MARPAERKPPVAFTPAIARAQPPIDESDLAALRASALPVDVTAAVEAAARSAAGSLDDPALSSDHQPEWLRTLLHAIGDARVVMIGEATHGTEEFYR